MIKIVTPMPGLHDPTGMAALSICDAPLLAVNGCALRFEHENLSVLQDATTLHANAIGTGADQETHAAAAGPVNSLNRPDAGQSTCRTSTVSGSGVKRGARRCLLPGAKVTGRGIGLRGHCLADKGDYAVGAQKGPCMIMHGPRVARHHRALTPAGSAARADAAPQTK